MPGPTLSAEELGEELGRSTSYVYEHWKRLVKKEHLPHPLNSGASPLMWSRAQVYAWLDRELSREQRLIAQAYRAAAAAAANTRHTTRAELDDAEWRARLDARFQPQGSQ